jgi:pimeloyl-ACP methyl ester carboxylesterase
MGGLVAQLLYRRHAALVSGLVLCSTARDVRESPAEQLAAVALPPVVAALQWNPVLHLVSAEVFGTALVGRLDDPATASWARTQLRRTTVATAVPAIRAVCGFTSASWISQVGVPTAVVVTTGDRIVPPGRQLALARAPRRTRWTPVTGHASPRRSCSRPPCSRHAGRQGPGAAARCATPARRGRPGSALHPETGRESAGTDRVSR